MKVTVLGSGVVGVTTAWFLARDGHEVTVVDRQPAPGQETSYANAGEISPGYSTPWAAPGLPFKALRWLFMRHSPLILHLQRDPAMYSWMGQFLRNCTEARYQTNKARMLRLAEYSRDILRELRQETGLDYDQRSLGLLQLFRTEKQLDAAIRDTPVLDRYGVRYELLDRDGCVRAEQALTRVREKFAGGLRLPGDETGDCHKFTRALAGLAEQKGVKFLYGTSVESLHVWKNKVVRVETSKGDLSPDVYVVALGSYSPLMLRRVGIELPIIPVKGYSITVPVVDEDAAPVSTIMDETHKVAVTRLGSTIRVAGMAELAGYDLSLIERRRETLQHVLRDLFPDGGNAVDASFWCGLRSMTPDSVPLIGPTGIRNLYVNTGHGTLGWTMACGSAKVLADAVAGRTAEIDAEGLGVERFSEMRPSGTARAPAALGG